MNNLMRMWYTKNKYRTLLEKAAFPFILFVYPLLLINQGIDISDTLYSLGYYRFMDQMDTTWVLATYLANEAGSLLMQLPFGDTLLGMNIYTSLIVSAFALICYFVLRKWISSWIVFLGELIAVALCWCPTVILYNYLTYFFMGIGCLLLYRGIMEEKEKSFFWAGICLGLNVMVRFSNLPQAALILVVWFACRQNRNGLAQTAKITGYCIAGYLSALLAVMLCITVNYGFSAYTDMIAGLFGMTAEAADYTLGGMVSAITDAYAKGFKWLFYMLPCGAAGCVMFYLKRGRWERAKKLAFVAGMAVLLRFYLGRGMFTLRYYDYECVFQWMMLFLILGLGFSLAGIFGLIDRGLPARVMSCMVLVVILITPLGSNNYTFPNMNNMFLVAPYTLWAVRKLWMRTRKNSLYFPWQAFLVMICVMTLVQGVLFGTVYVFRDGTGGAPRDTQVEGSRVLAGMYTTSENAKSLSELIGFWETKRPEGEAVLIWGDAPGLSYILDVPSAIFTTWPEITSNTYDALDDALLALTWEPPIILHNDTGKEIVQGEKTDLILDFIVSKKYTCIYKNENYQVFISGEAASVAARLDGRIYDSF